MIQAQRLFVRTVTGVVRDTILGRFQMYALSTREKYEAFNKARNLKLPAQEWLGYDPEKGDIHGYTFEQMREFAGTLIKECMKVAKYHTPDTEECEYTWLIHEKIKQHFGVEE
jgi:hypothetical protein